MRENPKKGELYKYIGEVAIEIITLAKDACTKEVVVVYQTIQEPIETFVIKLNDFLGKVDPEKYPKVTQNNMFEKYTEEEKDRVLKQEAIDPILMEFLETDTYLEKLELLVQKRHILSSSTVNTMAVALDIELIKDTEEERFEELKDCLITFERFECNRLR